MNDIVHTETGDERADCMIGTVGGESKAQDTSGHPPGAGIAGIATGEKRIPVPGHHFYNLRKFSLMWVILPFLPRNAKKAQTIRCEFDFHDYYDDKNGWHPTSWWTYHCERCGKEFTI